MLAASGVDVPVAELSTDTNRRSVVSRLRESVVSIVVIA